MGIYDLNDLDLDNVPVLEPVAPGEYKVRITQVFTGSDKNGADYWRFRMEVVGQPEAKDLGYFLSIPNRLQHDAKQFDQKRRTMAAFIQAFDVNVSSSFDPETELPGCEAWALLDVEDGGEFGMQNRVKRWITGK